MREQRSPFSNVPNKPFPTKVLSGHHNQFCVKCHKKLFADMDYGLLSTLETSAYLKSLLTSVHPHYILRSQDLSSASTLMKDFQMAHAVHSHHTQLPLSANVVSFCSLLHPCCKLVMAFICALLFLQILVSFNEAYDKEERAATKGNSGSSECW